MSTGIKVTIGAVAALLLIAIVVAVMWVGWKNTAVDLETRFVAQEKSIESYYDKMWKVLQQQASITDKYAGDFEKIYVNIMEGRYSSGGTLMKWVQERNPEFDSKMYSKLQASVEAQREGFHREQQKVIDIVREHDNLRKKFPSSLAIGDYEPLEYVVISSTKSKQVMETREENDIDLFSKDK